MGHTRLGNIPKSRKWSEVLATLAEGSSISANEEIELIALKTLDAAEAGLQKAFDDLGLRYTFYILTQLALASRQEDWEQTLSNHNIDISNVNSTFDLISEVQISIDDYISDKARATDISEIAQQSFGESISVLIENKANTLFGSGKQEIQTALKSLSTKTGFSDLGQKFFGRFMTHYLNFYLSRVTAAQVGTGKFRNVNDISKFNQALQTHCEQTARIVRDFCGEWYSKTSYLEGITLENTSRFMYVAIDKLKSELKKQKVDP